VEKCVTAVQATDDNKTWRMCFSCWLSEATDIHLEYVILVAFPQLHLLREGASVVRHTSNVCFVHFN
jgi:hypothetical protein